MLEVTILVRSHNLLLSQARVLVQIIGLESMSSLTEFTLFCVGYSIPGVDNVSNLKSSHSGF